jgi:hypothetical protein
LLLVPVTCHALAGMQLTCTVCAPLLGINSRHDSVIKSCQHISARHGAQLAQFPMRREGFPTQWLLKPLPEHKHLLASSCTCACRVTGLKVHKCLASSGDHCAGGRHAGQWRIHNVHDTMRARRSPALTATTSAWRCSPLHALRHINDDVVSLILLAPCTREAARVHVRQAP